jgi:hypothetical protein
VPALEAWNEDAEWNDDPLDGWNEALDEDRTPLVEADEWTPDGALPDRMDWAKLLER